MAADQSKRKPGKLVNPNTGSAQIKSVKEHVDIQTKPTLKRSYPKNGLSGLL